MNQTSVAAAVAADLALDPNRVESAVRLLDDGNTVPFIARYRKEMTDTLDEEQLRNISERLDYRRAMEARRETILHSLAEQDVLTSELQAEVESADTLQRLEDLYRPYRPKRQTRATVARQKGLQPLADLILAQPLEGTRDELAAPFATQVSIEGDDAKAVTSLDEAYQGARDIVAETVADDPEVRAGMRRITQRRGVLHIVVADRDKDANGVYQLYYDTAGDVSTLRPHQVLAFNRGEHEGVLKVTLEVPEAEALGLLALRYPADMGSALVEDLIEARRDGYSRLLFPAIEREVRRELTEMADEHAIGVFATNLRALLLQPPMRGQTVLGIDPGYRTGCKVAVVDTTGKVLDTRTIYPDRNGAQAKATLNALIKQHRVTVVAIGNGTASRETEGLVASVIRDGAAVRYTIVSEAGASVYSASRLARAELPDLDVSIRGAVSIARRLQDPLAELVKIEPKAIGVGLYQHDVDQKALAQTLDVVVESTVNSVGADLNTASPALLRHISGIGPKTADAIVAFRDERGAFDARETLKQVSGIGPRTFEQAAGFLRVSAGKEALDNTPIHPESYDVARSVLDLVGLPLSHPNLPGELQHVRREMDLDALAVEMGTGRPTLEDILEALTRPGRDLRDDVEGPVLRSDVLSMEDLQVGMRLKGTVRNVVDFGAFVDIGVKQNGLVHISQMGDEYVRNPHDKVAVGDVVEVEVLNVDTARGRIGLALL
ncbi:MAG: RNA-binding transcriptional accessory protein [Anaerolineae bacterium]|nr:RNA-binding transcriptional accessory protein [Anaerolineae bacterium]